MQPIHQTTDTQLAELNDLVSSMETELRRATADQQEIERELDRMLAFTPMGCPLNLRDRARVQAGLQARSAFHEFKEVVERFRKLAERTTERIALLQGSRETVRLSINAIAAARARLEFTELMLAHSKALLLSSTAG